MPIASPNEIKTSNAHFQPNRAPKGVLVPTLGNTAIQIKIESFTLARWTWLRLSDNDDDDFNTRNWNCFTVEVVLLRRMLGDDQISRWLSGKSDLLVWDVKIGRTVPKCTYLPVQIVQLKLWIKKGMCWNKKKVLIYLDIFTLYFLMSFLCVFPLPTRTGIKIQRGVICQVANKVRESRCIFLIFWTSCEVLSDSIPPKSRKRCAVIEIAV